MLFDASGFRAGLWLHIQATPALIIAKRSVDFIVKTLSIGPIAKVTTARMGVAQSLSREVSSL
jgi:hypothetical protein